MSMSKLICRVHFSKNGNTSILLIMSASEFNNEVAFNKNHLNCTSILYQFLISMNIDRYSLIN